MSPLILPFEQLCHICIKLGCCFSGMIKARASGSKVYLYFMKKGRQARYRIPWNSCLTLKAPNKNCSRRHFNFLLLSLEENKA